MVTDTTTRTKCDANTWGRAARDWGMDFLPCQSHAGLRSFTDAAGVVRHFCAAPGHGANAQRRFGLATTTVRCCICGKPSDDALAITINFGTGTGPLCWRCQEKGDELWSDDELVVEENEGYLVTAEVGN